MKTPKLKTERKKKTQPQLQQNLRDMMNNYGQKRQQNHICKKFQYIGSIRKYKAMIKKKTTLNKQKLENEPEIINSNQTDKDQKKKILPKCPPSPPSGSKYRVTRNSRLH